jgi:hypothetical protein
MALWRDATAGALGPGQGDYDPYGDLSSLVRQIAPGIGSAAQTALQPQFQRPDDSFAAYMADPLARSDADIQQRAAAGPPSAGQSLSDLGNMVLPYLAGAAPGGSLSSGIRAYHGSPHDFKTFDPAMAGNTTDPGLMGQALYFSTDPQVVAGGPHRYEVNLDIKSPLELEHAPDWRTSTKSDLVGAALGIPPPVPGALTVGSKSPNLPAWQQWAENITNAARAKGHDAAVLNYSPTGYSHQEVAVYDPSLISIIKKYGLAGLITGGAAAGATSAGNP